MRLTALPPPPPTPITFSRATPGRTPLSSKVHRTSVPFALRRVDGVVAAKCRTVFDRVFAVIVSGASLRRCVHFAAPNKFMLEMNVVSETRVRRDDEKEEGFRRARQENGSA